ASLYIRLPRCDAVSFVRHGPFSNAARAAATALSTSAASASATCVIASPVAGLIVGNVFPELASTHLLLIRSLLADTFAVGSIAVGAVAIARLLSFCLRQIGGTRHPLVTRLAQTSRAYAHAARDARRTARRLLCEGLARTPNAGIAGRSARTIFGAPPSD